MFKWKNMTPHPIDLYRVDCNQVLATFLPSGEIVRPKETDGEHAASVWLPIGDESVQVKHWEETENYPLVAPCVSRSWGSVEPDLPYVHGQIYIVAMPVLSALGQREDICYPDFGAGAVRNGQGTIIGTRRFVFKKVPEKTPDVCWHGPMDVANLYFSEQERSREENYRKVARSYFEGREKQLWTKEQALKDKSDEDIAYADCWHCNPKKFKSIGKIV